MERKLRVIMAGLQLKHAVADALDGESACYLARKRAAHAVGDGKQRPVMALIEVRQVIWRVVPLF